MDPGNKEISRLSFFFRQGCLTLLKREALPLCPTHSHGVTTVILHPPSQHHQTLRSPSLFFFYAFWKRSVCVSTEPTSSSSLALCMSVSHTRHQTPAPTRPYVAPVGCRSHAFIRHDENAAALDPGPPRTPCSLAFPLSHHLTDPPELLLEWSHTAAGVHPSVCERSRGLQRLPILDIHLLKKQAPACLT